MAEGPPEDPLEPVILPPEAVRTPEGRQRVLDLLDYIERQKKRYPPPPGTFSADPREVKRALGLE